jgi:hypothetical protein
MNLTNIERFVHDSLHGSLHGSVMDSVRRSVRGSAQVPVWNSVRDSFWEFVHYYAKNSVRNQYESR